MAPEDSRALIEAFLKNSRQPALLEPGEDLLPMAAENSRPWMCAARGSPCRSWDRTRNLDAANHEGREESAAGRLELTVERFARRQGQAFLLDLARPSGAEMGRRSGRLVFRERFRLFLRRQFPEWTLAELSAEPRTWNSACLRLFRALF